ncbi:CDGSH iron-sulfur domain-containing protein [Vallitalea okinawensis]|uniref:CDGSH iron-sulfur domain-containing protein n=1 Tax=Vallitalea okinawensis TaxID=2078660 RepID=UPI000CFC91A7|nr:CDGSH iron-sulfur domain-containing protein [Vallitalea okinawensis]
MPKTRIQIKEKGPLIVSGEFELVDEQGNIIPSEQTARLCRCGESSIMPFCESSLHNKKNE